MNKEKWSKWINKHEWTTAKSSPHQYIVKSKLSESDQDKFEELTQLIREEGYTDTWAGKEYTYLNIEEYRYWTMGNPIQETTVLNRAKNEE